MDVLPKAPELIHGRYKNHWLANRAFKFQKPHTSLRIFKIVERPEEDPKHPFVLVSYPWSPDGD